MKKVYCITGGSGTFGIAALNYLLGQDDVTVRVFSRDEAKQSVMERSLTADDRERVRFILGDVRDAERVRHACAGATYVLHAAALKRIEKVQADIGEAFKTNVLGSLNVAQAAEAEGCEAAVLISSDKATDPVNFYGVSKLAAEHIFSSVGRAWGASKTRLMSVRYGNVFGSRGSVIELYREAARNGKAITVSHPDATRFFWSIEQAVQLAAWTVTNGESGHVYAPVMRAARMGDIATATGAPVARGSLHDAEKLHESIVTEHESRRVSMSWCEDVGLQVLSIPPVTGVELQEDPLVGNSTSYTYQTRSSENAERIPLGDLALALAGEDIWSHNKMRSVVRTVLRRDAMNKEAVVYRVDEEEIGFVDNENKIVMKPSTAEEVTT